MSSLYLFFILEDKRELRLLPPALQSGAAAGGYREKSLHPRGNVIDLPGKTDVRWQESPTAA